MNVENKDTKEILKGMYHYFTVAAFCEKCSDNEHPIQMELFEGMLMECPLCHVQVSFYVFPELNVPTHYSKDCERCQELEKKNIKFGRKVEK